MLNFASIRDRYQELLRVMKPADSDSKPNPNPSDSRITLETIISVGVFGWLTIGMVLMGLGIW
ncbi:MAG: hypothetical protein A4E19_14865 [Nitrospira sp. SG-bin1]|nr:MAG: hypothetical protein A4E19_14865 [Nitrospira sp. SG-bin1]